MKVDIVSESDDQFKIEVKKFGEVFVAKDEDGRVSIGTTEDAAIEAVEEMQELAQQFPTKAKQAVPLENKKGLSWFEGTSWGNN